MRKLSLMAVISWIESIGVDGWEGEGWLGVVGSCRLAKANIQTQMTSEGDTDCHNSQGRPGLLSESVRHPMQSY